MSVRSGLRGLVLATGLLGTACAVEGASGSVDIVGRWRAITAPPVDAAGRAVGPSGQVVFTFAGRSTAGSYTESRSGSYADDGCVTETTTNGTWTRAADTLTLRPTSGVGETRGCRDASMNRASQPIDLSGLAAGYAMALGNLTDTSFSVQVGHGPALAFTRQ